MNSPVDKQLEYSDWQWWPGLPTDAAWRMQPAYAAEQDAAAQPPPPAPLYVGSLAGARRALGRASSGARSRLAAGFFSLIRSQVLSSPTSEPTLQMILVQVSPSTL